MTDAATPSTGKGLFAGWLAIPLWVRIVGAMVLGSLVGGLIGDAAAELKIVGDIFVGLIKMLVVPILFTTLAAGVVGLGSPSALGRTGLWTIGLYLVSGLFAVCVGITLGGLLQPGTGLNLVPDVPPEPRPAPTWQEALLGVIPSNPLKSMLDVQALPIIVFAFLFGLGLLLAGEEGKPAAAVIESAATGLQRLTSLIMELAPFGVFALLAFVVGTLGIAALLPLISLVVAVYVACFVYGGLIYSAFVKFVLGLPIIPFYRGMADAMSVAYATSSSNATLPVTMRCVTENLGVPRSRASFVISLGATVNMDGTAMYLALVAIFGAQVFGVQLQPADYIALIFTATLGAIGAAGIPGGSFVMMPLVLGVAGIPVEVIPLILAVDRLMDMMRTVVNVLGDGVAAVAVTKWDRALDEEVYRAGPDV